jgi:hypothetical protein
MGHANGCTDQITDEGVTAQQSAITPPNINSPTRIGKQTLDGLQTQLASHNSFAGPLNATVGTDESPQTLFTAQSTVEHLYFQQEPAETQSFQYLMSQLKVSGPYNIETAVDSRDKETSPLISSSYRVSCPKHGELVLVLNSIKRYPSSQCFF